MRYIREGFLFFKSENNIEGNGINLFHLQTLPLSASDLTNYYPTSYLKKGIF